MENLRQEINNDIIEYMENTSKEGYKRLIDISRKLDELIVNYIKSSNK